MTEDISQLVQLLSRVRLFVTSWTAASQASLSMTNSWSLLKPMSIELVMPSKLLTLCCPVSPSVLNLSQHWGLFQRVNSLCQVAKILELQLHHSVQFSSVTQSCPTLCDHMNHSMPGLPVHHQLPSLPKLMSIESVMQSNHLILCRPLLLLPSIFPSIRVFSNESALRIRWPKYQSFSFNISPSNEHSGLISFRKDWLDLLAVP